jgi:protease-4
LFSFAIAALIGAAMREPYGNHVALIRVSGAITGGRSGTGGLLGDSHTGAEDVVAQLERARKCKSAKAIVIRINSPGGSAAGSEEVYNEIMRIRKSGKPVYTSMADVAASGGYFIASACDRIYADATTITGSIGVIFSGGEMSELYKKIGYRPETIKSGKFKDIGSPARPMTPEEHKMLQAMIDNMYDVFLSDVAKGRKLPKAARAEADRQNRRSAGHRACRRASRQAQTRLERHRIRQAGRDHRHVARRQPRRHIEPLRGLAEQTSPR